jgi:hypothetical protein
MGIRKRIRNASLRTSTLNLTANDEFLLFFLFYGRGIIENPPMTPPTIPMIIASVQNNITFLSPAPEFIQPQMKAYKPQIKPSIPFNALSLNIRIKTMIQQTTLMAPAT